MQYLVFEFDTEKELREVVDKLWNKYNASGELRVRAISGGRWRLEMNTEKEIRDATLEQFSVYRAEPGD